MFYILPIIEHPIKERLKKMLNLKQLNKNYFLSTKKHKTKNKYINRVFKKNRNNKK